MTHGPSHVAVAFLALAGTACGNSLKQERSCVIDDASLPKAWFVADPAADTDQPVFTLTIRVTEATFAGDTVAAFVGAAASTQVSAKISESLLTFREVAEGEAVAAFNILRHQASACAEPYNPSMPVDGPPARPQPPWQERGWFRIDWSTDLAGAEFYAFDAATAAGYPNAVDYHALSVYPPDLGYDLESGQLAFRTGAFVTWHDIDEETKGCIFDFPDAIPDSPCPMGELRLAYELSR